MIFTIHPIKAEPVTVKKAVTDKTGADVLLLNIVYPAITGPSRSPFVRSAAPFYKKTADAFAAFALGELAEKAKILSAREGFQPMAAVMKTLVTFSDKHFFSTVTEASVFDGESETSKSRSTHVWDVGKGIILSPRDVFAPQAREKLAKMLSGDDAETEKKLQKHLLKEGFALEKDGIHFYLKPLKGAVQSLFVSKNSLNVENLLKISF